KPALLRERLLPLDVGFLRDVAMLRARVKAAHLGRVMFFDELTDFLAESLVFLTECEIHIRLSVLGYSTLSRNWSDGAPPSTAPSAGPAARKYSVLPCASRSACEAYCSITT